MARAGHDCLHFGVAPPSGLDEQPYALLGERLVQKAVHRAVGDLRSEQALLLEAARDDEHQLGELRAEALRQLRHGRGDRGAVEHRDTRMMLQQRRREVDLRGGCAYLVRGIADLAQCLEKLRVLGESQQRIAGERKAACSVDRRQCQR